MEKCIGLFYFSGTGNTRIIADLIREELQLESIIVETFAIDELLKQGKKIDIEKYYMIGLGHPIYGFGAPRVMERFIDILPVVSNKNVFIFKTGADFISVNHNSSGILIRKLQRKGYNVFYDRIICMGSNFYVKYTDEFVKQLYLTAVEKVKHMCKEILSGKERIYKNSILMKSISYVSNFGEDKILARLFGKTLKVTKHCIQCGKCIKNCPTSNIYMENNKIRFKWDCTLCMRCIYQCPNNAIMSRGFNFIIFKDGYDIKGIIQNPNNKGEFITKDTKGFMKHFNSYLNDISI